MAISIKETAPQPEPSRKLFYAVLLLGGILLVVLFYYLDGRQGQSQPPASKQESGVVQKLCAPGESELWTREVVYCYSIVGSAVLVGQVKLGPDGKPDGGEVPADEDAYRAFKQFLPNQPPPAPTLVANATKSD